VILERQDPAAPSIGLLSILGVFLDIGHYFLYSAFPGTARLDGMK
jgi:hypothetical protein